MKAWVLHGIGDLRYEERELPQSEEGFVRLKVSAVGICGSDVPRTYDTGAHRHPLILGHEFSAVVDDDRTCVPAELRNRRVGVFPLLPCGKCDMCREKRYEMCRNYDYLGSRRDGAFAEYVTAPLWNLLMLPEEVSSEDAAMLEPLAVAVHAVRRGTEEFTLEHRAPVVVCGMGTIGMLILMVLTDAGYENLYMIGNKETQRKRAASLGYPAEAYCDCRSTDPVSWSKERTGGGAALYFESVGRQESISQGPDITAPGGRIVLVGNPASDICYPRGSYWNILRKQQTVCGTWNSSYTGEAKDDWHYALERIRRGSLSPSKLISHRLQPEEMKKGLDIMHEKREDYCKIMVVM